MILCICPPAGHVSFCYLVHKYSLVFPLPFRILIHQPQISRLVFSLPVSKLGPSHVHRPNPSPLPSPPKNPAFLLVLSKVAGMQPAECSQQIAVRSRSKEETNREWSSKPKSTNFFYTVQGGGSTWPREVIVHTNKFRPPSDYQQRSVGIFLG